MIAAVVRENHGLDWRDDPEFAGPEDWTGRPHLAVYERTVHLEPQRLRELFVARRPYNRAEYTDWRCAAAAAAIVDCEREDWNVTPHAVVQALAESPFWGPGCREWVLHLLAMKDSPWKRK